MATINNRFSYCLWFDNQAEEAAAFYTSLFAHSKTGKIARYGKAGFEFHHKPEGTAMTVPFELEDQRFLALNGGPNFKFNPSISFFVVCETEAETDKLWSELGANGTVLMALEKYPWSDKYGWLQDRFGISWQIAWGKTSDVGQKITPSMMFVNEQNGRAEEAMNYYTSIFKPSDIDGILHYGPDEGDDTGSVRHAQFSLEGQKFMVMDSSLTHAFSFNEAISIVVNCASQKEVDYYWEKLTAGGDPAAQQCGWLKDKFGVSWQVVPIELEKMLLDPDTEKSQRVTQAFLPMKKLDIEALRQVYTD